MELDFEDDEPTPTFMIIYLVLMLIIFGSGLFLIAKTYFMVSELTELMNSILLMNKDL